MTASLFPLHDRAQWVYAVTDPMGSRFLTVTAEPPQDVEVTDLLTLQVRRERAWVLRQSDREALMFAVQRDHGVELIESCTFGKPERKGLAVTADLRWAGPAAWSLPYWHYVLQTRHYRRAADEEVTVPAGAFRCVKILLDEGRTGTVWLAPGVGLVRTITAIEGLVDCYSVVQLQSWDIGYPAGGTES